MIWRGLSQILAETGKLEGAEYAMREALRISPQSIQNWVMLAAMLSRQLRLEDALDCYERALSLRPTQPARIIMSKGHLLKTLGRRAECEAAYLVCIAMEPENGEYYWCLADLKTYRFDDAQIAAMQSALASPRQDPANAALLHFALARAFEQRSEYARAFEHYAQANSLRRRDVQYDAEAFEVKSQRIRAVFTQELVSERLAQLTGRSAPAAPAAPLPVPIFIVGLPRSGSTLLEQILASHSLVEGTMELPHILNLMYELDRTGGGTDAYPEVAASLPGERFAALGQRYLKDTAALRSGKPFFIDKMPNNFRHLGFMRLLLPQALFIDARRHPMDACFSAYKQYFAEGQAFTYDLEDLGSYYRGYLSMMNHWKSALPGRVLTVHYEKLVKDTEAEVRRLLGFCGLPFEPATLRFHENGRPVRTASSEQVRQPIYDSGVGHWRHFEEGLAPLKRALGPALANWSVETGQ